MTELKKNHSGSHVAVALEEAMVASGVLGAKLLCPCCGYDYVATAGEPRTECGQDSYKASWPGRGDLTVIPCKSECGSHFDFCLGQHKGQLFAFTRLGVVEAEDDGKERHDLEGLGGDHAD